jgi:hypothetical protein
MEGGKMGKRGPLPKAKMSVASPIEATKADKERERRWRAEDALRTCEQYAKIQNDKQLMSDVKMLAKEKMNELQKVVKK